MTGEDAASRPAYEATENATTENASTNEQGWKTQVQQLKEYFEEFTIFQSCIFSRSAASSPVLYQTGVIHKKSVTDFIRSVLVVRFYLSVSVVL